MPQPMEIRKVGNIIELSREQWRGHTAKISDFPGLLEEVKKHTWTYSENPHPYLNCGNPRISLHKFVLSFLYGAEFVNDMLAKGNIIEHLDNDGLNCSYDNLHILSDDLNKAKAFSIDKEQGDFHGIPSIIIDVYYSHVKSYYQMQIVFNRNTLFRFNEGSYVPVERLICQYDTFRPLFTDWYDVLVQRQDGLVDPRKLNANRIYYTLRPQIQLTEAEKDAVGIERNGEYYLVLRPDGPNAISFINKTAYLEIQDEKQGGK